MDFSTLFFIFYFDDFPKDAEYLYIQRVFEGKLKNMLTECANVQPEDPILFMAALLERWKPFGNSHSIINIYFYIHIYSMVIIIIHINISY